LHKFLPATAVAGVLVLGGPALADPFTIDVLAATLSAKMLAATLSAKMLAASSTAKMLAGLALALSGLTVTASMFIVRKWLWRYLGVHASDLLRRFGSIGLLLAALGIAGATWSADNSWITQQVPEPWLRIGVAAGAALLGAIALRAIADVIWGRDSKWGRRVRYGGSGLAALGLASVLIVQAATVFPFEETVGSIQRLKEIGPIQRIVQMFRR
jgi:hypothetical protein